MTIIVFLIDTSASMYQRAYLGGRPTLLDVAKGAVETFVKVRQRCPESRGDRYMLLTFEDPPNNIKAGWKENLATFMNELKNLQCYSMTTMGAALKHAFDVLNLNRMQTGIDTYGQGRCPFFLEPSVIVVITDGGKLSSTAGVQEDFNLPMHSPIPGTELTREPFRWDQRLFALVLRLAGTPAIERDSGLVPSDASPIDAMCEVTGGRSYSITSHRMLMQCIDSLVQKVQSGVVINFEKIGPDPLPPEEERNEDIDNEYSHSNTTASWHNCRRLIYVPRSAQKGFAFGFWPIPESFWPEFSQGNLPPRSAHPNVKFTCTGQEPMVIENLPFDKYELEPSPLTQYILARKQPTVCWQVFVANSYKSSEVGHPFGYLKASTNLTCVNLFVMPYNYPVLLPLLEELFKVHRLKPTNEWRTQFQNYMRTMPAYYAVPLRRALTRMGVPVALAQTLIPDIAENSLNNTVQNYLKRLKSQAKSEFDKLCNDVINKQNSAKISSGANENMLITVRSIVKKDIMSHPLLQDKFPTQREQLQDFMNFVVGVEIGNPNLYQSYRNPFDIPRDRLLDQVIRMRSNYLQTSLTQLKLIDDDLLHSMPVNQMGNYQEYLKRQTPQLREIESAPVRQHMFGNPFKIDKRMMVDEADIDLVGGGSSNGAPSTKKRPSTEPNGRLPNKRKPGPLPRELVIRKPSTDSPPASPIASPLPSPVPSPAPVPYLWPPQQNPEYLPEPENPIATYSDSTGYMNGEETPTFVTPPATPEKPITLEISPPDSPEVPAPAPAPTVPPPPIKAESPPPVVENCENLSFETKQLYYRHNQKVKGLMYRELRLPGKGFKAISERIQTVKGGVDVQICVLKQVIYESKRFKQYMTVKKLEGILQDFLVKQQKVK